MIQNFDITFSLKSLENATVQLILVGTGFIFWKVILSIFIYLFFFLNSVEFGNLKLFEMLGKCKCGNYL